MVACHLSTFVARVVASHLEQGKGETQMDELTRITHTDVGYTIATGYDFVLAEAATRSEALSALFYRGFTPQAAVASLNVAAQDGAVTVHGLTAA